MPCAVFVMRFAANATGCRASIFLSVFFLTQPLHAESMLPELEADTAAVRTTSSTSTRSHSEEDLVIRFDNELLSVDAYDVSLRHVLTTVAELTNIHMTFTESADEAIVLQFSELPLDEGLEHILRKRDYLFVYGEKGQRLRVIKVYGRKNARSVWPNRPTRPHRAPREPRLGDDFAPIAATALGSDDPDQRLEAVEELAGLEDENRAADVLLQVLERETDERVREAALEAVADFDDSGGLALEAAKLSLQDQKQDIRLRAVEILSDLEAWDELRMIARSHSDPEIREDAIEALEWADP